MPISESPDPVSTSLLADLAASFDHAPWAVTELSGEAHVVRYANPAFCRLIGKRQDEVVGRDFANVLPSADEPLALLDRVFRTGAPASYTAEEQLAPRPLLFSYNLWPVMADGCTAGVMIQVNETGPIHETRRAISLALLRGALRQDELIEAADLANAELRTEINERRQREIDAKMLANEVAHRVKNNLQVVAALISNEIRRTPAPWEQGYRAMQNRIMAIAQLYDIVSQSSEDSAVALEAYLTGIARTLSTSLLGGTSGIRIAVEAEPIEIDSERAVPFGLLVNELGTNAVKHAFPGGRGLVTIALRRIGNEIELRVADDGIGMPVQEPERTLGKHGSDYIGIFARQLQGSLVRSAAPGEGTTVTIRFPLAAA
ncbi:MAG: PAS domain-containing protein [Bauldia sp.]|nr:PAS domain-containing protein [Bauldia sp.]